MEDKHEFIGFCFGLITVATIALIVTLVAILPILAIIGSIVIGIAKA